MERDYDYGKQYLQFNEDTDSYAEKMARTSLSELSAWFPIRKDISVLDIGCGMGFTMLGFKAYGFETIRGVDVDRSQVEACQRRGLKVELIQDLRKYLAKKVGIFSLITMIDVLEHIPKEMQIKVLRGCLAALAPGGRLIVRVPNANSIVAARMRHNDFTHYCSFTEASVKFVLLNAGFEDVQVPYGDSTEPRPSLRPSKLINGESWTQFKRWIIRRCWRQVLIIEAGQSAINAPLGVNLYAISDKSA